MALEIKFEITEAPDRKSFTLTDTTGLNYPSNDGGWGAPNPDIADAIPPGIIEVIRPGSTATYSITASNLPSDNLDIKMVLNTDLGLQATDTLPDGPYIIRYMIVVDISGTETPFSAAANILLSGNIDCCLQKIGATLNPPDGECCKPDELRLFTIMKGLLKAACFAVGCGKLARAQVQIDYITDYCSKNCSGC